MSGEIELQAAQKIIDPIVEELNAANENRFCHFSPSCFSAHQIGILQTYIDARNTVVFDMREAERPGFRNLVKERLIAGLKELIEALEANKTRLENMT